MFESDYLPPVENPSLLMGRLLVDMGAILTSENGEPLEKFDGLDCLGIVVGKPFLSRESFIGVLYFKDKSYHLDGKNWIFRIHDREFIDVANRFIGLMLDKIRGKNGASICLGLKM